MTGILFAALATFFGELSTSIGKYEIERKREGIYVMGFLTLFWATVFFFVAVFVIKKEFIFSAASLPTFIARALLEIIQAHVTLHAISVASRSTFSFLRVVTLPLLLLIDFFLGYDIGAVQVIGIGIIVLALILGFSGNGVNRTGSGFILFTAINGALTISLYKYNITHFNSVETEGLLIHGILLIYFFAAALFIAHRNPFIYLTKPIFLLQSLAAGVGSVILSFAYVFAPASVITTAKRSFELVWSILYGKIVFYEQRIWLKVAILGSLVIGLILLIL